MSNEDSLGSSRDPPEIQDASQFLTSRLVTQVSPYYECSLLRASVDGVSEVVAVFRRPPQNLILFRLGSASPRISATMAQGVIGQGFRSTAISTFCLLEAERRFPEAKLCFPKQQHMKIVAQGNHGPTTS